MKTRRIAMVTALAAISMSLGLEAAPERGDQPRERRGRSAPEARPEINQNLMQALRNFAEAYNSGNKEKARAIARRLQNRMTKASQQSERVREAVQDRKGNRPGADKRQKLQERREAWQKKREEGKDMRQRRKEAGDRDDKYRIDREALRERVAARRQQFFEQRRQYAQSRRGRDGQSMRRRPQMQDRNWQDMPQRRMGPSDGFDRRAPMQGMQGRRQRPRESGQQGFERRPQFRGEMPQQMRGRDRQNMPQRQMGRRGGFDRMGSGQRRPMPDRARRAPQERRGGQEQPRFFEVY